MRDLLKLTVLILMMTVAGAGVALAQESDSDALDRIGRNARSKLSARQASSAAAEKSGYTEISSSVAAPATRPSNGKMRLVFFGFETSGDISAGELDTLTEIFRTEIITSGAFEVVSRDQMKRMMEEQKLQLSGLTEGSKEAIKFGQMLDVKRAIIGKVTYAFGKYNVTVRLIDMETALEITARTRSVERDKTPSTVKEIAREMASFGRSVNRPTAAAGTLEEIEKLISGLFVNSQNYYLARERLDNYVTQNGESPKTQELDTRINKFIAEDNYNLARQMAEKKLYEKARFHIARSLELDPYNTSYIDFERSIGDKESGDERQVKSREAEKKYRLARQYARSGSTLYVQRDNTRKSQGYIREALALDPENNTYRNYESELEQILAQINEDIDKKEESERFWKRRENNLTHGGFDLYYTKSSLGPVLKDYYSGAWGLGMTFHIPIGDYFTFYNGFTYVGLGTEGLSQFFYKGGFRLHFTLLTIFDFYGQAGINYLWHSDELPPLYPDSYYANYYSYYYDDEDNPYLTDQDMLGFELGAGFKIFFTESFGAYAEYMFEFNSTDMGLEEYSSAHLNAGVFFGVEDW